MLSFIHQFYGRQKLIFFWASVIISAFLIYHQAHFISRSDSSSLMLSIYALLLIFAFQLYIGKSLSIWNLLIAAIFLRTILLNSTPWLSDDFYRFLWDGLIQENGINPYSHIPIELNDLVNFSNQDFLLENMNSPEFYSVYPPASQFLFYQAAKWSSGNIPIQVIILKCFVLLLESGSFFFLIKILQRLKLPTYLSSLYLLNPIVIIELSGNIHFEAGMIFGCLGAFYFWLYKKPLICSLFLSLGIIFKLWPILFLLPLFLDNKKKDSFIIMGSTAVFTILSFIPYYFPGMIENIFNSLQLYFTHFEFNAGLYQWVKFTVINLLNYESWLSLIPVYRASIIILMLAFLWRYRKVESKNNWMILSLGFLSIYLLGSSVIHPWYIIPVLAFSIPFKIYFPVIWTMLLPLSYLAYGNESNDEFFVLNTIIHLVIITLFLAEFEKKRLNKLSYNYH